MTLEEMQQKVRDLSAQREQHIAQANACAGAIQVYRDLIAEQMKSVIPVVQ